MDCKSEGVLREVSEEIEFCVPTDSCVALMYASENGVSTTLCDCPMDAVNALTAVAEAVGICGWASAGDSIAVSGVGDDGNLSAEIASAFVVLMDESVGAKAHALFGMYANVVRMCEDLSFGYLGIEGIRSLSVALEDLADEAHRVCGDADETDVFYEIHEMMRRSW